MYHKDPQRQVFLYSSIAFGLSIVLSLFIGLTGGHDSPYIAWGYASMFIPAITVGLLCAWLKMPAPAFNWNTFPLSWLPVALFLLPIALHAVLLPLYTHLGGNGLPWQMHAHILLNMLMGLFMVSALAFFEEIGWRAWLLPRLLQQMSARKALFISACICAFWHTPYDLSGIHYVAGVRAPVLALFNFFGEFGAAVFIGWLWLRTKSIGIVCLAHGALNNWGQLAFKYLPDLPDNADTGWLLTGLNGTLLLAGLTVFALSREHKSTKQTFLS